MGNLPIILGGDWNCTVSRGDRNNNIDILNMVSTPNKRHSEYLCNLCDEFQLIDPFRFFNPNRKEFTFTPRDITKKNRSRIDFFVVTSHLVTGIGKIEISQTLQSNLFDHKAVLMDFIRGNKGISRPCISTKILEADNLEAVVWGAIFETYCIHSALNLERRNELLLVVGRLKNLIQSMGPPLKNLSDEQLQGVNLDDRTRTAGEIEEILLAHNLLDYQTGALTVDDDLFFDVLVNTIRNDVISYQTFVDKHLAANRVAQLKKLELLKKDYGANILKITELESKINLEISAQLKKQIQNNLAFDILNGEKITPLFTKLLKVNNEKFNLSDIRSDTNAIFSNQAEREEHIVNFYSKLYSKPTPPPLGYVNCVENFLGPEICANPIVTSSKLNQTESAIFEGNFSLDELDKAIEGANKKSAVGVDGLDNRFIQKFWVWLRQPLKRYSDCCMQKGSLTPPFKSAIIKLIPKKGDGTKIGNWRPISLLSCMYKILSRALNNRLRKVSDKILSRSQKGFSNSRYIQEVLINVYENIAYCNEHNIQGALTSIDQAKAFDSVAPSYMREVYKFFGFGDGFLNMVDILCNNRTACIIMGDNTYSKSFNLESGFAQGNPPSPSLYNIGEQILLFKIELDPGIQSIYSQLPVPRPLLAVRGLNRAEAPIDNFLAEANRKTDKSEAFADDTNIFSLFTFESLSTLKNLLEEFGAVSGLKCNYGKTNVMKIGIVHNTPENIVNIGFNFVEELKILGFSVTNNFADSYSNFDAVIAKVLANAKFWEKFTLSLPGRINICKTFLLSQIGYIASILTPDNIQLDRIQQILDKFVLGKLNIAKDRFYRPPCETGLGLINIRHFVTGLQAAWIKKALFLPIDNWRYDISNIANSSFHSVPNVIPDRGEHPIYFNLMSSFSLFVEKYHLLNENYTKMPVFNNKLIQRNKDDDRCIDANLLGIDNTRQITDAIQGAVFSDFSANGRILSLNEINLKLGIELSLMTYIRIGQALTFFNTKIKKRTANNGLAISLMFFLKRSEKGSKKYRNVLTVGDNSAKKKVISEAPVVVSFFNLIQKERPDPLHLNRMHNFWSYNFLPIRTREFVFKFFNNSLGLNTRISNFVENVDRSCSLCVASKVGPACEESFSHLFLYCPVTKKLQEEFLLKYLPDILENLRTSSDRKILWFEFRYKNDLNFNILLSVVICLFQNTIWEFKLKKKAPAFITFCNELLVKIDAVLSSSPVLKRLKIENVNNYHIFRD